MSQQEPWHSTASDSMMPAGNPFPSMPTDVSSTFVKPQHDALSPPTTPYAPSNGTPLPIPPPPPYWHPQSASRPKSNKVYLIAIAILALMVVGLGSIEVVQLAGGKLLTISTYGSTASHQSSQSAITPAHTATASLKTTPARTLTPGTIKENETLTCGGCDDHVLTAINTITIDTTNLRMIWVVKLNNHSGVKAGGNASRLRSGRPGITNSTKHFQDNADGQTPARRRQARMSERRSKNADKCCARGEALPLSASGSALGRTPTAGASCSRRFFLPTRPLPEPPALLARSLLCLDCPSLPRGRLSRAKQGGMC
jgi:hypothetical protein